MSAEAWPEGTAKEKRRFLKLSMASQELFMEQDYIQKISTADIHHAVEIGNRIWWMGHYMPDDIFQCHAYLIEHGNESILIDPGGHLTIKHVLKKVEEVTPFSNIRYFICQHQDPDITGALRLIDSMDARCKDAVIVTHWRARELIKHYDLTMPFWEIEEHGWQLGLAGRVLKFIFTPYLHFPGAFCTFDAANGVLFSSDLFGGFTSDWTLLARDESHFENIRPFHEHYMPSQEILLSGITKIEEYPIKFIAPQHGSLIPGHLVGFMIRKLKQIDCGLFALARDKTDVMRLSFLNRTLKDITHAVVIYRDFRDIVHALLEIFKRTLPLISIEFYASISENESLYLLPETQYHGVIKEPPPYCRGILGLDSKSWLNQNQAKYRKILLPAKPVSGKGNFNEHCLLIPLFSPDSGMIQAIAILRLTCDVTTTYETEKMIEHMSDILGVAVERESFYRMVYFERKKFYEQSIRDPLTGLYNRLYMEEMLNRLFKIHDRNEQDAIVVVMLDIDHFKQVNDTYGHSAGDEVIKKVASTLSECIRSGDLPVRYGGEEFAVFVMGSSVNNATVMAEKIRKEFNQITFKGALKGYKLTISAGIASRKQGESFEDFIQRADMALYKAKTTGRNKVCLEDA